MGCVALRDKDPGSYVVAAGTRVGLLDWDSQDVQWVAQLDGQTPGIRVNDGKVDPAGRFVTGDTGSRGSWGHGDTGSP